MILCVNSASYTMVVEVEERSVWVSDLKTPVSATEIADIFSTFGDVENVIVPNVEIGEGLVLFKFKKAITGALKQSGKKIRGYEMEIVKPTDAHIRLAFPTDVESKEDIESKPDAAASLMLSVQKLPDDELSKVVQMITSLAMTRFPAAAVNDVPDVKPGSEEDDKGDVAVSSVGATGTGPDVRPKQSAKFPADSKSQLADSANPADVLVSKHVHTPSTATRIVLSPSDPTRRHSQVTTSVTSSSNPTYVASVQFPRVVFFSGDSSKSDHGSYLQWRNEVICLLSEGHPPSHILHGIRRSLKGTAAGVLLNLGPNVTVNEIVNKFDVIFGNALSSERLLEEFYSARQKSDEDVAVWGCRLETMLNQAKEKGLIAENLDDMKRSKFWSGLHSRDMSNALRHRYDSGESFTSLLVAARSVEHEWCMHKEETKKVPETKVKPESAHVRSQQAEPQNEKLDQIMKNLQQLSSRLRSLEEKGAAAVPQRSNFNRKDPPECYYCRKRGHMIRDCYALKRKEGQQGGNSQNQENLNQSGNE